MSIDPNNLAATAKLTFADEFNGLSLWNGKSGTWSSNWWYNDEWGLYPQNRTATNLESVDDQWYVNYNFAGTKSVVPWTTSNGVLTITADKTPADLASLTHNLPYTSGLLNTWHSFSQQYGYFEISAKMPSGQGLWPAFWLLPQDGDWPPEIDVFEVLGHDTKTLWQTVHSDANGSHTAQGVPYKTGVDLSQGFHTYGVDWQKDYITFYFDGHKTTQYATPADMNKPMYMIANMTVGGPWSGNVDANTVFPAKLQIDYIRVYSELPATAETAAPAAKAAMRIEGNTTPEALTGQAGDDIISGAGGSDTIGGGEGDDSIQGNDGADQINGNPGSDTVLGGAGDDWVLGGKDADHVYGDDGADFVHGNIGADTLWGGAGADTILGGQDDDIIYGGDGNDWMTGDRGNDVLTGGAGADMFRIADGGGVDRLLDFSRAQGDRIGLAPGASYSLAMEGSDTVVTVGSAKLVLVGVSMAALTGDWVVFG